MTLAAPEGLEPPTLGSEDQCSIQLSYGAAIHGSNENSRYTGKKMGWETGIEPATAGATVRCSAS